MGGHRAPAARAPVGYDDDAYDDDEPPFDVDVRAPEPEPQRPARTPGRPTAAGRGRPAAVEPPPVADDLDDDLDAELDADLDDDRAAPEPAHRRVTVGQQAKPLEQMRRNKPTPSHHDAREAVEEGYQFPALNLLAEPKRVGPNAELTEEVLESNAGMLEGVLDDFGIKGEIIHVRPGPVVTLYELRPAPGVKSSRVIGLADDIARSMSAVSARVAVVPGHNVIGIELPNQRRETVYLREMIAAPDFQQTKHRLAMCLGKTIGGEAVIVDLARMPHLLVAGTTGSGKSVAINTMIMSLLYRLTPEECKLIMIDPKMLELSVYDGIPHLLTPVVTDPKKAVVALKWTVKEMEDRYRKMSKLGVRNIDGYNARVSEAKAAGEVLTREIQTGFHRQTGEPIYETEELALETLPYIVVVVDEMADLMMVAGKEIEGAIQRLAQMARAAGIHIVMATQRPSVDVITGTIKANFPTRISFQVTSKIDSRTILGEQGAEQLLGQGDMLYMAPGGRIQRVHGPFISDGEVEKIVHHLKRQGVPQYLEAITSAEDEEAGEGEGDAGGLEDSNDLYDKAVAVVLRDRKASTSYIQRRLQIGYNRAASLIERMEREGLISAPGSTGRREILIDGGER
jgi:S-DNA-T family DNA segregation ATPase FtsK/SpoIIIE